MRTSLRLSVDHHDASHLRGGQGLDGQAFPGTEIPVEQLL